MSYLLNHRVENLRDAETALDDLKVKGLRILADSFRMCCDGSDSVALASKEFTALGDELTKVNEDIDAAKTRVSRCEMLVARLKDRQAWKARVFRELYEHKVIVEEWETEERALLRFLLDRE
jgi:hypothetical protein